MNTFSFLILAYGCSGATNFKDTGTDETVIPSEPSDTEPSTPTDSEEFGLQVNEVLSKSDQDIPDWIELTNTSAESISLSGYQLTDDYGSDTPWVFPEGTELEAGQFLIVWADDGETTQEELHADFKLSADGETLTLLDEEGEVVEEIAFPELEPDTSYGRVEDGSEWAVFAVPTQGSTNESP